MIRALADSYRAELVRAGSAWTSTGKSHPPAGLKHRPDGAIRVVPIPPVLVSMLCHHLGDHGTTPDGRLFRGARGGMLSESVYGRAWHAARQAALGPDLAATALARRPYDLRHAAMSLWLNASGTPAEVAAQAGHSARVATAPVSCMRSTCTAPTSRPPACATGCGQRWLATRCITFVTVGELMKWRVLRS